MIEFVRFAVGAFVLWMLFLYFVVPLIVYNLNRGPEKYALPEISWESFIAARSSAFLREHAAFTQLGFLPASASVLSIPGSITFFALYRHENDPVAATLVSSSNGRKETVTKEFTQRYENGFHLSLIASPLPTPFPRWRKKEGFRLPKVANTALLFEAFKNIRAKSQYGLPERLTIGQELAEVQNYLNEELEDLISRRYLSANVANGQRRFTLKGAYLMAWKLLWPWKTIDNLISEYQVNRLSR